MFFLSALLIVARHPAAASSALRVQAYAENIDVHLLRGAPLMCDVSTDGTHDALRDWRPAPLALVGRGGRRVWRWNGDTHIELHRAVLRIRLELEPDFHFLAHSNCAVCRHTGVEPLIRY